MHQTFVEKFTRPGGKQVVQYVFTPDAEGLDRVGQAIGRDRDRHFVREIVNAQFSGGKLPVPDDSGP